MSVTAYVAHDIPGRLRIRIPAAKGRPDLLQEIRTCIALATGIRGVECNPLTGSILIQYAPEVYQDLDSLGSTWSGCKVPIKMEMYRSANARSSRKPAQNYNEPSAAAREIASFFRGLDEEIRAVSDNEIDLRVLLPIAAVALGIFSYLRPAKATPLWLTLIIFAFHSFLSLHDEPAAEATEEIMSVAGDDMPTEET